MKILFHVGVGNTIAPTRWNFVRNLYSDLARSLESLGHECLIWVHPDANNVQPNRLYHKNIIDANVNPINFKPDFVFTWNGISDGDVKVIKMFGEDKIIYGELAFLDHYESLYFDFSGVNCKSSNIFEPLMPYDGRVFTQLQVKYKKPRLHQNPYIFIPLQDEHDSQIMKYSPFDSMDELLEYISVLYAKESIDILYKQHPISKCKVQNRLKFKEVSENVHHYLPYADMVIGINSTVLLETLLYHNKLITLGMGLTSRPLNSDQERKQYITHLYKKQMKWDDMRDVNKIKNSYFYKKIIK